MSSCLVALAGVLRPERLLSRLRDRGITPEVVDVTSDARLPRSPAGIVLIGGPVSPYDARVLPFGPVGSLIAGSVARRIPTLGIGGGAHLVAVALGARPTLPEVRVPAGPRPVRRTEEGRADALFGRMPDHAEWIECAQLALNSLPVGSEILAVDDAGVAQAARFGPLAWGLQGHPEFDQSSLDHCLHLFGHLLEDEAIAALRATFASTGRWEQMQSSWDPLLDAFAALVAESPGTDVAAPGSRIPVSAAVSADPRR